MRALHVKDILLFIYSKKIVEGEKYEWCCCLWFLTGSCARVLEMPQFFPLAQMWFSYLCFCSSFSVPVKKIEAVLGGVAELPCDALPEDAHDDVFLILWFKDDAKKPMYRWESSQIAFSGGKSESLEIRGKVSLSIYSIFGHFKNILKFVFENYNSILS